MKKNKIKSKRKSRNKQQIEEGGSNRLRIEELRGSNCKKR